MVIEHKAGNLVLTLGDRATLRNALGPNDTELELLPARPKKDSGAITHGLWQLSGISGSIGDSLKARFGRAPGRILSMITTLQPFEIDNWVRQAYLEPLLSAANAQLPATWAKTDWAGIAELEALAQLADQGRLDLVELLDKKAQFPGRFARYLAHEFGGVPADAHLFPVVRQIMREVSMHYFGREPSPDAE